MKALYFYGLGNEVGDPLLLEVNNVNGTPGSYGILADIVSNDSNYFWGSFGCDAIPCCGSAISSLTVTDGVTNYAATLMSFVGGRPARPIAK